MLLFILGGEIEMNVTLGPTLRIAASTYLNSAPLIESFINGGLRGRYSFIGDAAPAKCAGLLGGGECEVALIPAIEYQRIPGLQIVPGVAVASKGRVRSVLVATRTEPAAVKRLAIDTSSRTSQALVQILFRHRYGVEPELIERTPDARTNYENMFEGVDAALVIGDPAMMVEANAKRLGLNIHDLAAEWQAMTGYPFVFAVWAVRTDAFSSLQQAAEITRDFQRARAEGLRQLESIATRYAPELGLPSGDLLSYLQTNVNYDLDPDNLAGLSKYYELSASYGLIVENQALRFLPTSDLADESAGAASTVLRSMVRQDGRR